MDTRRHFNKSILYLHIAVMLFGLAGVAAQFVAVSAVITTLRSEERRVGKECL